MKEKEKEREGVMYMNELRVKRGPEGWELRKEEAGCEAADNLL
jgi:hypothetical protein